VFSSTRAAPERDPSGIYLKLASSVAREHAISPFELQVRRRVRFGLSKDFAAVVAPHAFASGRCA
jgi:hypothetical protein